MAGGFEEKGGRSVFLVDGARTPFLKARTGLGPFTGSDLAVNAGRALLMRQPFEPDAFDEVIVGAAMPSADEANIGRVVSLRLGCGDKVPAWTVMRNCASGMQALDSAAVNIMAGRSSLVLAGGTDAMSHAPLLYGPATCAQLLGELSTISGRLEPLKERLNRNATSDEIWVGVYVVLVILLPFTFFLIHGNGPEYEKYSWLLGERDAVQQQFHAKQCRT